MDRKMVCGILLVIIGLVFTSVSTIETYHGLTTSKPMQLRCFQSG